jgi:hypothetical protein
MPSPYNVLGHLPIWSKQLGNSGLLGTTPTGQDLRKSMLSTTGFINFSTSSNNKEGEIRLVFGKVPEWSIDDVYC